LKRILTVAAVLLLLPGVLACTEGPEGMFETAQFEELQHNEEHAAEIYEELIRKHPESDYARRAEERLREIRRK
jgi:TolA-binding protein